MIYLLHRVFTLAIPVFTSDRVYAVLSFFIAVFFTLLLGLSYRQGMFEKVKKYVGTEVVKYGVFVFSVLVILFCGSVDTVEKIDSFTIYPEVKQSDLDNCLKLSYIGDMLLFEEDIHRFSRGNNGFDFSSVFKNTCKYFGDYTIGVFEGVVGNDNDYSAGNYYDNTGLSLKYPADFAREVSYYVDLVNIGMNHLLDDGQEGIVRTRTVFDDYFIDCVGGYLSEEEANDIKIVDVSGMRIGILDYCSIMNNEAPEKYDYHIPDEDNISDSIARLRSENVDIIVALTHMGKEFNHGVTLEQRFWTDYLISEGVDIILNDHPHVVEPCLFEKGVYINNCPGNYMSSLTTCDQDYGMINNIYIDKTDKKVRCCSIIPIKSVVSSDGLTVDVCFESNDIVGTNFVLGNAIGFNVNHVLPEYFYNDNGYLVYNDDKKISYDCFADKNVCFMGDSITEGTKNNGHGWFEAFDCKSRSILAKGGFTSADLLEMAEKGIDDADVYVIAIGCNDIRYNIGSLDEYIENVGRLTDMIGSGKEIIIVAPWYTERNDFVSVFNYEERNELIKAYSKELKDFCSERGFVFIDINDDLEDFFEENNYRFYLIDGIHPDNVNGVALYSRLFYEEYVKKI